MQRLGGRVEPGGFGNPEICLVCSGNREGEAESRLECQAAIFRRPGALRVVNRKGLP